MEVGGAQHPVVQEGASAVGLSAEAVQNGGRGFGERRLSHDGDDEVDAEPGVSHDGVEAGQERPHACVERFEVPAVEEADAVGEGQRVGFGELGGARVAPFGLDEPDLGGSVVDQYGVDALVAVPVDDAPAGGLVVAAGHDAQGLGRQRAGEETFFRPV